MAKRSRFLSLVQTTLVVLPLVLALDYALGLLRWQRLVAWFTTEPTRLGEVTQQLTLARAEWERAGRPVNAAGEPAPPNLPNDPFDPASAALRLTPGEGAWLLCSVGPDRTFDGGTPIDRLTGQGDVCVRFDRDVERR